MTFRPKVFVWTAGGIGVLAFIFLVCTRPSSPGGRYVASDRIGAIGDWYYEFSGGKVCFVCHEDATYTSRTAEGEYFRNEDSWIWTDTRRSNAVPVKVQPCWFGIRLSTPDGSETWRRRLVPGRRPDWMLESLPWAIQ